MTDTSQVTRAKGQAMCGFVADVIDLEKLSEKQRTDLEKFLRRRKQELQERIEDLSRALKVVEKKPKR
jgi:hypothetical protein